MSKCGKGCMPECGYFTTGGCISPFNCIYKEESGYINSATSGTVIYTGGMNMPDEKMTKKAIDDIIVGLNNIAAKYGCGKGTEPFTNDEWNTIFLAKGIVRDYTALQKRLDNAVELPRLEISPYDDNDTLLYYLKNGHIQQECFNNKHLEQLQKRLAELKGGNK